MKKNAHLNPGECIYWRGTHATLRRVSSCVARTEPGLITTPESNRIISNVVSLSLLQVNEYISTITRGNPPECCECFRERALPLLLSHYLQQLITNQTPPGWTSTAPCLLRAPSQRVPPAGGASRSDLSWGIFCKHKSLETFHCHLIQLNEIAHNTAISSFLKQALGSYLQRGARFKDHILVCLQT